MTEMLKQAVYLAVVLAVLLRGRAAATVECFCSDCPGGQASCHGDMCTAQVTLNPATGEEDRRWRCLNDQLQICNHSSTIFSILCCNSRDNCNIDLDAELAEEEGEASGESSPTTNGSTVTIPPQSSEPEPTTPSSTTEDTAEPSSSTLPVTYTSGIECFVSESSQPILTSTTLCLGTSSCFASLRVKADGTRVYKRGCSRGNVPCEEEDRPRKKKTCCYSLFCNHGIPESWLEEGTATPTDSTPVLSQTPPTEPATHPGPASLSTVPTPSGSLYDENCTVVEEDTLRLTPCVGPGSVASSPPPSLPVTEPSPDTPDGFTGPVIVPENGTPIIPRYITCYCNTCGHTYQCSSLIGCSSQYSYNPQLDQIDILRSCITDYSFKNNTCGTNRLNVQTACCLTDMCNSPPVAVDRPTKPTEGNVTVETTEPITAGTDPVTNGTVVVETTASGGTTDGPAETDSRQEEDSGTHTLLFYVFSAVLGTLTVALILALIMMCICCYSYQRRGRHSAKLSTGGRGGRDFGGFSVATRKIERVAIRDKVADLQDSSCTTSSTRTSTPESIV